MFMNWMREAQYAFEVGQCLPPAPPCFSSEVERWIDLIRSMEAETRQNQVNQKALEATLSNQAEKLGPLVSNLCENLAALYDTLGEKDKAKTVRMRAAALSIA